MNKKNHLYLFFIALIFAAALDFISKLWAEQNLSDGKVIHFDQLKGFLSLKLTHNPGASFSIGSNSTLIITAVATFSTLMLILIDVVVINLKTLHIGLGLIAGGSIGNLLDRFITDKPFGQGEVTDFISWGNLFVGNVSDVLIIFGVFFLLIGLLISIFQEIKPISVNRHQK